MPDPWTDAWAEAEASAPANLVVFATLELRHPAFQDSSGPFALRIVANTPDDQVLTLESGAPLNGGQAVTFKAVPFLVERPEVAEGRLPQSKITIDNVARDLLPYLEQAAKFRADLIASYREFRSDDRAGGPVYGPVDLQLRNVSIVGATLAGNLQLGNLTNTKFPSPIYQTAQFPGLLV